MVEQRVIDTLREVFELNGFIGIETRAVEQGSSLLKKGETSKEIYLLSRLQEVGHESDIPVEQRLGLHFDLTVPLSRYVVEHSGALPFPFKRWQIQKVWRGERPQEGRFREFVQADIDVVGDGTLPSHYEVELPLVMVNALERLREFGLPKATVIEKFNGLCEIHHIPFDGDEYAMAKEGLDTLSMIIDEARRIRPGSVMADLKIARGLDYYTGSVYETFLEGASDLGSICSGGRYDNLATQGNRKYPGVGLSIGLSRLVSYMLHRAGATASRMSPACVLVAVWDEENRGDSNAIANTLRSRGIAADVAPTAAKLGKQIKYADKLGIPYVWFPNENPENDGSDEVKNIITGDQRPADAQSWQPDTVYAQQTVSINADNR